MKRHFLSIVASCVLLVAAATSASAAGFALYEWSARGNALGGTLVGRADDPSAVAFNPAGITQLEGTHIVIGGSVAAPITEVKTSINGVYETTDSKDDLFLIPHFYVTHKINDKWSFGFGEFSRFGLGFGYDEDWPGAANVYQATIKSFSLNPNIAYKVNDRLSVALGVEYINVDLNIKKRLPGAVSADPTNPGSSKLEGDGSGVALTAGLHYKLDKWRFGVGYHSQAKVKAEGTTKVTGKNPLVPASMVPANGSNDTEGTVVLPDMISFGITYYPIDALSIEVAAVNTRWSTYTDLDLEIEGTTFEQPKDWHDVWRYSIGVEYDINESWAVRGGYVYDESPDNSKYVDYMIPAGNRHLFSAGVGYKYQGWTIDVAYTYIKAEDVDYDKAASLNPLNPTSGITSGDSKNGRTHIAALTIGYSF